MKEKLLLLLSCFLIVVNTYAQNVGIGTTTPTRAKLELHGAVDGTSAIFGGEGSGISLQRNWPGVGFNTYYGAGSHRYIANGFGVLQLVDPGSGYMAFDMFGYGTANSNVVTANRSITFNNNGNIGIRSAGYSDISLFLPR